MSLTCGFCGQEPEAHGDSDAGPMTVCRPVTAPVLPEPTDEPEGTEESVTVYFNPFAFTIEQNNEFLRKGYEVMPLHIPSTDA